MKTKQEVIDDLLNNSYTHKELCEELAERYAKQFKDESERLKSAMKEALKFMQEKRGNHPGFGAPINILKTALEEQE